MNTLDEQLIALGAVFEAATLVDRIARTGQVPNASLGCMLGSLLAFEHGEVPATLNYETPDDNCPVNVIHGTALPVERQTAVVLGQAMMGQAVTIVLHGPREM